MLQSAQRRAEALPLLHRALHIFETSLGLDHPRTLECKATIDALSAGGVWQSRCRGPRTPLLQVSQRLTRALEVYPRRTEAEGLLSRNSSRLLTPALAVGLIHRKSCSRAAVMVQPSEHRHRDDLVRIRANHARCWDRDPLTKPLMRPSSDECDARVHP